jgi:outer membrane protein OmpA-like peptidoglycan-associated protein
MSYKKLIKLILVVTILSSCTAEEQTVRITKQPEIPKPPILITEPEPIAEKLQVATEALNQKADAMLEAPTIEVPKIEAPKIEAPKIEVPKIEVPKIEVPKIEARKKIEAPKKIEVKTKTVKKQPSANKAIAENYQTSPMYLKKKYFDGLVILAANLIDTLPKKKYYESLDTKSLIKEAERLSANKDYEQSLLLFYLVSERKDSPLKETYLELYQNARNLNQQVAASDAFQRLLAQNVIETKKLTFKFLFAPQSSSFTDDKDLRKEYSFWLHEIVKYFENNKRCFQIIGHTGKEETDNPKRLSLQRAKKIQLMMKVNFPMVMERSTLIGKGDEENIIGIGTNDMMDILDRRVELNIINCASL